MKLVINSPGVYLCKRGDCFQLQKDDLKQEYSAKKVEQILITTRAALSTDAIELAIENNIDIIFLKSTGQPLGRVWHSKLGSISTIRRKQLFLQEHPFGLMLVKEWIVQKLENQIEHLNKLAINRRDNRRETIKEGIEKIKVQINNIKGLKAKETVDEVRDSLQGYEGSSGRVYFEILSQLIPEKYKFNGRSRNPARDEFNCLLNYGYGILYSNVEKACILAGLDPYIGIMHTDNYNKKALVFDLVEMYRGYIDEIVFKLFTTKKIKKDIFDEVGEGGYYLNQEGKKLLITEYNKEMERKIRYKGRNIELQNIVQYDCHSIANQILKEDL
ncbi:CRISPR-associated endonuclease Cas1 [Alkaliphilus peptidifermentans]|uniref:CRISPR-associated endonuclease Cas1 n=1 Tax=Alkaliphilus peptidifermentans DSM 18978 TaxID=1120976 RepID=A0A1G5IUS0_9FIRM|nr:CRISPR-associated endonuclease Cas1 [Alkaliphilus peptidifermentans]SCY79471.1 CRISPR-associated protein, Cas1 family [Alkaliphilus peptidifermentans DSM 18978]